MGGFICTCACVYYVLRSFGDVLHYKDNQNNQNKKLKTYVFVLSALPIIIHQYCIVSVCSIFDLDLGNSFDYSNIQAVRLCVRLSSAHLFDCGAMVFEYREFKITVLCMVVICIFEY